MIDKLLNWAKQDPNLKALVLTGSRANDTNDGLSDYDIALLVEEDCLYLRNDRWMSSIDQVWLYIPEKIRFKEKVFKTRLVIFKEGVNVDFTFISLKFLDQAIKGGAFPKDYRILLDKDGIGRKLKAEPYRESRIKKPSEKTYHRLVEEFWFEVYQIAKNLKRDDLWVVKYRDAYLKHHLVLKMIEWLEAVKHDWNNKTFPIGKRMKTWVTPSIWKAAHGIFPHFDNKDSWESLFHTLTFFRDLAIETAKKFNFTYPNEIDQSISGYVTSLKEEMK